MGYLGIKKSLDVRIELMKPQIAKLLEIKWWNWSREKIEENLKYFENIEKFIRKFDV
jgi:hypothetical protein